jgi:hypothetical protein
MSAITYSPTATVGGICGHKERSSMKTRLTGKFGLGVLAGTFAFAMFAVPALAETDDEAPPPDPDVIAATVALYMSEFSNADLDGDGNADFVDTDGDGIPNIPEGEPGDLDLRPGDGRFGTEVTDAVTGMGPDALSASDQSSLLHDCGGMAVSYDSSGNMVDWAIGVGSSEGGGPTGQLVDLYPEADIGKRAFTKSNPFHVKDKVIYFGRMPGEGDGARNHTWTLKTGPISIDEGGDDNPDGNNRNAGEVDIGDDVPGGALVIPTGIYPFEGHLDSTNGVECWGEGWVRFDTAFPPLTAAGLAAGAAGLVAIFGLLFNVRPAITWKV